MGHEPQTEAEKLREVIREAHIALKDLKAALKECREERERMEGVAIEVGEAKIQEYFDTRGKELADEWGQVSQTIFEKVTAEAQRSMNLAVYGNAQGRGVAVFALVQELRERLGKALSMDEDGIERMAKDRVAIAMPNMDFLQDMVSRKDRRKIEKRYRSDPRFREKINEAIGKDLDDADLKQIFADTIYDQLD